MKLNPCVFSLCVIIALGGAAFGVPANSKVWTFTQPDGTTFQAVLLGDEFYSYHQTLEGEIILQDRDSGEWFYAEPRADGSLQKTPARVGQDTAATSELNREKSQWVKAIQQAVDRKTSGTQGVERVSAKGTIKGVLLLADFSDTSTTHTPSTFNSLTNTTGYQSNGASGSVKDYYWEASYGQLTLQTDVYGWFKLPKDYAYYGEDDQPNGKTDINIRQMIEDAIAAADPTVNFADYDSDGDRWVDMFGVVHQGLGQEVTGRDSNYIWSHRWFLSQPMTVDGVRIQYYYTVPELSDGSQLTTIGVFCHEIGHFLGLPDLYDTDIDPDLKSHGVGDWSVMGSGSWLGPDNTYNRNGTKPCHFDPWCKYMLGWIAPQVIYGSQSGVSLPGFDTHPTALLIPVDPYQDGEYFLVANRYKRSTLSAAAGFDQCLPGSGALILHVDDYTPDNKTETRKKVDVEEADGLASLDLSRVQNPYNSGDVGDLYPNGGSMFDDSTNPNSRDNDGLSTGIAIYNFTGAGTDMMACDVTPHTLRNGYTIFYDSINPMGRYIQHRGYQDGDDYACVRFVTDQGGMLERVKTYFTYEGTTDYTISIYSGWLDNNKPTGLLTRQSGSHTGSSYEEIFLSEPQTFDKGAEFVIEIRYNTWGGYGWPLPAVDDGDCSERTYVRSNDTAAYFQYTTANDRPYDALIRAGLRAPSPSSETAVKEYVCTHAPQVIPDPNPRTGALNPLVWTLNIPDAGAIVDLNVKLNVNHTKGGDLTVSLGHNEPTVLGGEPRGRMILSNHDGSWTHGQDTIFDDEAPLDNPIYCRPYENLSVFDGESITGEWELIITDDSPGGTGTLYSWSLIIELEANPKVVKLTPLDGSTGDGFGDSVSISGDCAIVGAPGGDGIGPDSGSAYIFERQGMIWSQRQKLTGSDDASGAWFGSSASISRDYAIVGEATDRGCAYVFERIGSSWTKQQRLTASDGASGDWFGSSVSISGDYAIVGNHGDDDNGTDSGSVYVFKRTGSTWGQPQKLMASDGRRGDWFGYSVLISGDYAIVGAIFDDDNGSGSGSAYIFKRVGSSWGQQAKVTAPSFPWDPVSGFGSAVSLDGDYAVVGAPQPRRLDQTGSAYLFQRSGANWTPRWDLRSGGISLHTDFFGASVSISGDYAVVGAEGDYRGGSAYVFKHRDSPSQSQIVAPDRADGDLFGESVSVSGGYAIMGAPGDDDNGTDSGSAYIFRLSEITN